MIYFVTLAIKRLSFAHQWDSLLAAIYRLAKAPLILMVATLGATSVTYGHHELARDSNVTWAQTHPSSYTHNSAHLPDLDSSHYFLGKVLARSNQSAQITDDSKVFNGPLLHDHQAYLDKARNRRQQLIRKWTKPFKLSIVKYEDSRQRHHFYLNTLRQEFVGKAHIGALIIQ